MIATSTSSILIMIMAFTLGVLFGRSTKGMLAGWIAKAKNKLQAV